MTEVLRVEGITKRYGDVTAVKDADLNVGQGDIVGLLGPSGAGKSTLLRIMDLLEPPDAGRVFYEGTEVDARRNDAVDTRRKIGMILQKPVVLNRSVANNLAYPLMIRGVDEDTIVARVEAELKRLGLEGRKEKNARTLSGGEMQRLCFARALMFEPEILLMDEFAANLDPANVAMLENSIKGYMSEDSRRSAVLITHNLFQAKRLCSRVAFMWGGELVEVADRDKFFESPSDPRTRAFVAGELVY